MRVSPVISQSTEMNAEVVLRIFKKLENDQFTLVCMGDFDDQLTASLLRITETASPEPIKLRRRLSVLIAEAFQNIIRHSDKPEILNRTNNKPNMLLIRNIESGFCIATSNLIDNTKKVNLESKLRSISSLSSEELKTEYLHALANNPFSDKGGAGLGLLQMALKSNNSAEFGFDYVNYFLSVFFIQIKTPAPEKGNGQAFAAVKLADTKNLYNELLGEQVILLQKGNFSQQSILPLIEFLEKNKKKFVYILIELLQNISKHALEIDGRREGIFILSVKNGRYLLRTGNLVETGKATGLKKYIRDLSALSPEQLEERYKTTLLKKDPQPADGAGLGLIEIGKFSTEKMNADCTPVTETHSFFVTEVTV
jgi:hypothetical protein